MEEVRRQNPSPDPGAVTSLAEEGGVYIAKSLKVDGEWMYGFVSHEAKAGRHHKKPLPTLLHVIPSPPARDRRSVAAVAFA